MGKASVQGYGYQNYESRTITDKGHTLQVDLSDSTADLKIMFADQTTSEFTPLQFHFHAQSEHTVGGKHMDLELHIVHRYKGTAGDKQADFGAVIGIFFDQEAGGNTANAFLDSIMADSATTKGFTTGPVELASFLTGLDFTKYWQYDGSLTTPPCWEGIKWTVLEEVQPISAEQLAVFSGNWADDTNFAKGKGNHRVVQPLNARTLYYHTGAVALASSVVAALAATALF